MKEKFSYGLIYAAVIITVSSFIGLLGYIFIQGSSELSWDFITQQNREKVEYVTVEGLNDNEISFENKTTYLDVTSFNNDKVTVIDENGKKVSLDGSFKINRINDEPVTYLTVDEVNKLVHTGEPLKLKVTLTEHGIFSMIIATLYTIVISLLVALPIGVISAIYLIEYQRANRFNRILHFAIDSLAGIPSIIYGLFGLLFFSQVLHMGISLVSGSLTVSIMLLPTIIRTTEEALLNVPQAYREASLGVGASKLQTIVKVVLPNAMGGIIVAVILAVGRVIGESAILVFTAGTVDRLPSSVFDSASTLTVKAYLLTKEYGDVKQAAAIGIVIIVIIILLNLLAKLISKKFNRFA